MHGRCCYLNNTYVCFAKVHMHCLPCISGSSQLPFVKLWFCSVLQASPLLPHQLSAVESELNTDFYWIKNKSIDDAAYRTPFKQPRKSCRRNAQWGRGLLFNTDTCSKQSHISMSTVKVQSTCLRWVMRSARVWV